MTATPQISLRDGSATSTEVAFSTNAEFLVLTGSVPADTVSVQVALNGGVFSSDSSWADLNGTAITIPNPTNYPEGYPIDIGVTTVQVRVVDIVGGVSPAATATITRVANVSDTSFPAPSGIKVSRERDAVSFLIAAPSEVDGIVFKGFNVYASTSPGGTTGYFRVNQNLVTSSTAVTEESVTNVTSGATTFDMKSGILHFNVTQEDSLGQTLATPIDLVTDVFSYASDLRVSYVIDEVASTTYLKFSHNRAGGSGIVNSDQWSDVSNTSPLYYVATSVYYDSTTGQEYESSYSQEVLGKPLVIDTTIRDLPGRVKLQIVTSFIDAIQRANSEISLVPGSTTRDVSIDPFASEAERLWFILDFVSRSGSFLTLLQIDDANGDGVSDAVATSPYKTALKAALGFSTDSATQQLIDSQFDKLAGNFSKKRSAGRASSGQVVFYRSSKPSVDAVIPANTYVTATTDSGTVRFMVGGTYTIPAADADAFYNFDTRQYEITASIVATDTGSKGNVPAGLITNISSAANGFSVVNREATVFGRDLESNYDLARRAQLGFSVDTGTDGGYASLVAEQTGVLKAKIVKAGDPLMMRDYDEVRGKHIGGKVDIWIQGLKERTVSETFAFSFQVAQDVTCKVIDATNLIFRVLDSRVTSNNPLTELLDNPVQGLGVRNASLGKDYDLTGATLLDYQTFQLNSAVQTFTTSADDVVKADYRFRSVNKFVLGLQPVRRITSVVGKVSGALSSSGYALYKTEDPLLNGESTLAENYVQISQVNGVPSGNSFSVADESHVMIGFFEEKLLNIGINTATLRVYSADRTTEYAGPDSATPDYAILPGTPTTPVRIVRTAASTILSGQTVSVDYDHDENFTVTYVVNDILQQLQRTLSLAKHTTADVLVKQAVLNSVDLDTTVQLKSGAKKDTVDPKVRTGVSLELNSKLAGQGSAQSDLINAIDSTEGVDFQVLPLARMGYADNAQKIREGVSSQTTRLPSLDRGANLVYLSNTSLKYPTSDGGGPLTSHRGVFQDDLAMTLASDLDAIGYLGRGAYIIGASGAIIPGYSDDDTITATTGASSVDDIAAERLVLTANRVVLSLEGTSDIPENHTYSVSYLISGDRGPHDIEVSDVEVIDLGALTITYRTA